MNSQVITLDDIKPGMSAKVNRVFTDQDVRHFAELTGDNNPVHLDDAYASQRLFGQRISHGMLIASLFSALLGTRLPGHGAIYVTQTLKFKKPVYVDSLVTAKVMVISVDLQRCRVVLETTARVGENVVITGEAEMFIPQVIS